MCHTYDDARPILTVGDATIHLDTIDLPLSSVVVLSDLFLREVEKFHKATVEYVAREIVKAQAVVDEAASE
jgi:hypothetical protein